MSCIEHARQIRQEFIQKLGERGFPAQEGNFLTGIEVNQGGDTIRPYAILDLGRMSPGEYDQFKSLFPEAAEEIEKYFRGEQTSRKWSITSGLSDLVRVKLECRTRVEGLIYVDDRDHHLHIE